jgi:hypothetical protein
MDDLNRFEQCAGAYGAARRRWPEREHALYDRLADTPEGTAILAQAERTDRLLDAYAPAAPQARAARRVAALSRPAWRRLAVPAAALAASAALGFAVGFAQVEGARDADFVARLLLGPQSAQEIGL